MDYCITLTMRFSLLLLLLKDFFKERYIRMVWYIQLHRYYILLLLLLLLLLLRQTNDRQKEQAWGALAWLDCRADRQAGGHHGVFRIIWSTNKGEWMMDCSFCSIRHFHLFCFFLFSSCTDGAKTGFVMVMVVDGWRLVISEVVV